MIKPDCFFFVSETECSCCKDIECRACPFFKDKSNIKEIKETAKFLDWYYNARYYKNSHTPKDN